MKERPLKTVGVRELKNNLSAYLREVRRGARVLVADRNTVVAELHEPTSAYSSDTAIDPVVAEWIREGAVAPPTRKKEPLPASPVRLADGTSRELLEEGRAER
jgi:antitoxin (DNA-binding transcriptional repressor) of toxin-antitoxin stability system